MSTALSSVDLTSAQVGTAGRLTWDRNDVQAGGSVGLGSGQGHIRLYNESGCGLLLTFGDGSSDRIPSGGWHIYAIPAGSVSLGWEVEYIIPGAAVATLLAVVYSAGERIPPGPVLGNSPVGISGSVTTGGSGGTSFIKNDANAPATSIIESTPSDQGSSSESWNNDASGTEQILSANVLRIVRKNTRGNATTGKAAVQFGDSGDPTITTFYGQVGAGSGVPTSTITGTLPQGQVGAGYPAASLGAGTLPAGVTVPGGQVSGAVATAQATNTVDNATMTESAPIARADQALAQFGFGLNGSAQTGFNGYDKNVSIEGQNNTQSMNSYFNGTADLFITAAAALQWQVFSGGVRLRWSTNAAPTAGASITWSAWVTIYDNNANFKLNVPAAQIVGSIASTQQVDSTHSTSTSAPQIATATAGAGLSVQDNKAGGYVELHPTMNDATARGLMLDYIDAAGALHQVLNIQTSGAILHVPSGDLIRVSSLFNGTGAGTFTHGLGRTPGWVGITTTEANSTETVGVDSIGSSTVHVNQGVSSWPWIGLATV